MFGTIRRFILSGIDIQRGILDYAERLIEEGTVREDGETPLKHLRTKLGDDVQNLREVVHDVVKNTLQTGLHQIDAKLNILNEHISALENKKTVYKASPPSKTGKAAAARKPTTKKRKSTPKKPPPVTSDEPIIDG